MMWTALAIRLFAVTNRAVPVTFQAVKLGHGATSVQIRLGQSSGRFALSGKVFDAPEAYRREVSRRREQKFKDVPAASIHREMRPSRALSTIKNLFTQQNLLIQP